ncbi:MAG: carboxylate--amine ligase [Planctomycetota bacterium]|jgi:predicted ATP-grasp superfamily ATP-dependent carboligase
MPGAGRAGPEVHASGDRPADAVHATAAVLVGLDSMQGLQAARILHDRGVPVVAIAGDRTHHACRTNTCNAIHHADTGDREVVDLLLKIGPDFTDKPVLFPCQDKCVRIVSRHRDELAAHYRLALPPADVVELLMDKDSFYSYAAEHGLPIPATRYLDTREDAERAARELPFPCLLKPRARTATWDRNTKQKVFKVESAEELLEKFDGCRAWADLLVVQQWIEGDDTCLYSCNCYYDAESRPLATFVARKLRQWPPQTGSSCLGEEVRNDVVLETTLALFGGVGYHGLGYVEMKRDARTGEHYIIEPNIGRPTGRSAIAEAGGVALLYTMYCDTLGLPLPPERTQTYTGTKWIDLRHDLQSAFSYWRRGELGFADWWRSIRGRKAFAVFSWRDPAPFVHDLLRMGGRIFRRRDDDA